MHQKSQEKRAPGCEVKSMVKMINLGVEFCVFQHWKRCGLTQFFDDGIVNKQVVPTLRDSQIVQMCHARPARSFKNQQHNGNSTHCQDMQTSKIFA